MIAITAAEKHSICKKYPNAHIVRTMKQDSKRHHYYMVEVGEPMRYLNELRGTASVRDKRRGSVSYSTANRGQNASEHSFS